MVAEELLKCLQAQDWWDLLQDTGAVSLIRTIHAKKYADVT